MPGPFNLIFMDSMAFRAARLTPVFKLCRSKNCCVDGR